MGKHKTTSSINHAFAFVSPVMAHSLRAGARLVAMAHSLRAGARLVAMAQKPMTNGVNSQIQRKFGTTSLLKSTEDGHGAFYYLVWKRKFTWIFLIVCVGSLIFEYFHPDKENRRKNYTVDWSRQTGGAYRGVEKENPVTKD